MNMQPCGVPNCTNRAAYTTSGGNHVCSKHRPIGGNYTSIRNSNVMKVAYREEGDEIMNFKGNYKGDWLCLGCGKTGDTHLSVRHTKECPMTEKIQYQATPQEKVKASFRYYSEGIPTSVEQEEKSPTIQDTLKEREPRYGEFSEHARITQNLKQAMVDSPNWASLPLYMKESLEMVAHKMGRILNGDPHYIDSWHDIVGYTQLVKDILTKGEQNGKS